MQPRPLVCLLAALALSAASCGGGAPASTNSPPPSIFLDRDLQGDWIGSITPAGGSEATTYIRCAANGYPFAGADGTGRDWSAVYPYAYSVVKPDGDVFLTFVVDRELFYMEGVMTRAGTMDGRYWVLLDGLQSEQGEFHFSRSSGTGTFSGISHLLGSWSGTVSTAAGLEAALVLSLAADGSLVGASREGVAVNLAASSSNLSFSDDGLGRLHSFDLVFSDGSLDQVSFALVSEDGMFLEGPVTDSVLGQARMALVHD